MNLFGNLVVGTNNLVPTDTGKLVRYINFDNSATTPAFVTVVKDMLKFLPYYSSIHRGMGYKSQVSTKVYESGREVVAKFLNTDVDKTSIVFVKNTTEAINKLSNKLYSKYKNAEDCVILSTDMEHHSNDLPWRKFNVKYVKVDENGRLSMEDLQKKLKKYKGRVKLVAVTGASNVTGYKNHIYTIAKLSHHYGAKVLIDGAQYIPHVKMDMRPYDDECHLDYVAFSAHKMYAPFGIGVLAGPKDEFSEMEPDHVGGGTIDVVTHQFVTWKDSPEKDEAGSPNVLGVLVLISAIKTLNKIGMDNIERYEKEIFYYTFKKLQSIPEVIIYKDMGEDNLGIIPFNIEGIYHETLAKILSYKFAIGVRSGCFCAQPYIQKLMKVPLEDSIKIAKCRGRRPGMVRLSFGMYNNKQEIDYFICAIRDIIENKQWYLEKYDN